MCNQDYELLISILTFKTSFLVLSFYDLRVVILITGFHNAMAPTITKEVRPSRCTLFLCAH